MNCTPVIERVENGWKYGRCPLCKRRIKSPDNGKRIVRTCRAPRPKGVGDFLKELLAASGIKQGGCGCKKMIARMNAWGPSGCIEHMAEILDHLQAEAVKRAPNGALSGERYVAFDRDLVEIAVLMAIGRAEEAV